MMNDELAIREAGSNGVGEPVVKSPRLDGPNQRLAVVSAPASRAARPVTNLAKVFGQFAEVQQQVAEQVMALEESFNEERQEVAAAAAQLPELRERINWLIASFYEQSQQNAGMEERLKRQSQELAAVQAAMQSMCEAQRQWQSTVDQIIDVLIRARSASPPVAGTPEGSVASLPAAVSA
jgi:septal ring factor EnvC (AmiA/AmiB activator)